MIQDTTSTNQPLAGTFKAPVSNDHYLLPLHKEKYAPSKRLTPRTTHSDLNHFIEYYNHLCAHYDITSSQEKCRGLIGYCDRKIARMIEKLPSYVKGDFKRLVKDLYYFMEEEDDSYNLAKVDHLTRKWRKRAVDSMEDFKRYHRKFLELVGRAIGSGTIDQKECNRHFWEGIHRSLRRKIEEKLSLHNPNLDVSIPFEMEDVIAAVNAIFNRKRFDQHLFSKKNYDSDTESEEESHKPARVLSDSEDDKDSDSDASDTPTRKRSKNKSDPPFFPKLPVKKTPQPAKRSEKDEMSKLTEQMSQLKLYLMQKDPEYRDAMDPPQGRYNQNHQYNPPQRYPPRFTQFQYNTPLPQHNRPPNFNNRPANQTSTQYANASYNRSPQREAPPHMNQNQPAVPPPQDSYCFGCGQTGHRMNQCTEINTLINQGTISRNQSGKLCWPDGSFLLKDREETWVQAVNKAIKRSNVVRTKIHELNTGDVYQYIGIDREDSDASSEEQEELDLTSGTIADCYAVGADRNPKISKDARKQVQFNPPSYPQRVEKFPERRNLVNSRRQDPPINNSRNLNSNQHGNFRRPTPVNVHQGEFEGKDDNQFLPMEVDQCLPKELGNDGPKVTTNQPRTNLPKSTNPGTTTDNVSAKIIQGIMEQDVTVRLGPLLDIAPTVRRNLLDVVKGQRGAVRQTQSQDKNGKDEQVGKVSLEVNYQPPLSPQLEPTELETRDDLLTVSARVGNIKTRAVFDSGSQANIISEKCARICGLPIQIQNMERIKISGIDGGVAQCVGIIPDVQIFVTESDLETSGQLLVVRDAAFKLLLGRPWGTRNGAGIREAAEGTYLSFNSQGKKYEINVSPSLSFKKQIRAMGAAAMCVQQIGEAEPSELSVASVTKTTPELDNETERYVPQHYNETLTFTDKQNSPKEQLDVEDEEEETRLSPGEWDDGDDERDNRDWSDEPYGPFYTSAIDEEPDENETQIDPELQEVFMKMVHDGVDDVEWNQFCRSEKLQSKKNRKKWREWKRRRIAEAIRNPPQHLGTPLSNTINPSLILTKLNSAEPPSRKTLKSSKESNTGPTRKTQRVRHETRRARESEFWQNLKRKSSRSQPVKKPNRTEENTATSPAYSGTASSADGSDDEDLTGTNHPKRVLLCSRKIEEEMDSEDEYLYGPGISTDQPEEPPGANREPGFFDWTRKHGKCGEFAYQCGSSVVLERDMSIPFSHKEEDKPQPCSNMPNIDKLLGADGTYDPSKTYPKISRNELVNITHWCDYQTENQEGRNIYFTYSTDRGTVVVSKIFDSKRPEPRLTRGERLIELERSEVGILQEVPGTRKIGYTEYPEIPSGTDTNDRVDNKDSIFVEPFDVKRIPRDLHTIGSVSTNYTKEILHDRKNESLKNEPLGDVDEKEVEEDEGLPVEEDNAEMSAQPTHLEDCTRKLVESLTISFPLQEIIEPIPILTKPGKGLLAAQELMPIARYDTQEDIDFYGKGVTIVWNNEAGEPTYHRGDALIRISQRDTRPGPKPPSRRRLNFMRERLFAKKTLESAPVKDDQHADSPKITDRRTPPMEESKERGKSRENNGEEDAEAVEMSRAEIEAVIEDLMNEPLEIRFEKRTYCLEKQVNGRIEVTRIPPDHEVAREAELKMEEEISEWKVARDEKASLEALTKKGSDPQTPDRRQRSIGLADQKGKSESELNTDGNTVQLSPNPSEFDAGDALTLEGSEKREKIIKETEGEDLADSSPHLPRTSSPIEETPPCSPQMTRNPPNPQSRPPLSSVAYVDAPRRRHNVPLPRIVPPTLGYVPVPTSLEEQRAGLVTATHLVRLTQDTADPRGVSFFGFGSTVLHSDPDGRTRSFRGNTLVHLFEPELESCGEAPRPPTNQDGTPPIQFFRSDDARDEEARPERVETLGKPRDAPTNELEAPEDDPTSEGASVKVERERRAESSTIDARDREAAEILVSMRFPESKLNRNLPPAPESPIQLEIGRAPSPMSKGEFGTGPAKGSIPSEGGDNPQPPAVVLPSPSKDKRQSELSIQGQTGLTNTDAPGEASVKIEPDEPTVPATGDIEDPGSPPKLWYPAEEEERVPPTSTETLEDQENDNHPEKQLTYPPNVRTTLNVPLDRSIIEGRSKPLMLNCSTDYREWKIRMNEVRDRLRRGEKWTSVGIREIFSGMRMVQWWFSLSFEMAKDEGIDWNRWKEQIVDEWMQRFPNDLPTTFRWMADDLEEMLEPSKPVQVLGVRRRQDQLDDDIEMVDDDAPKVTSTPPNTPRIQSPQPIPTETAQPKTPLATDPKIEDLGEKVSHLENKINETARDIQKRISQMEHELLVNSADLADLRWRTAELEDQDNERKTETQRKLISELDDEEKARLDDTNRGRRVRRGEERAGRGHHPHKYWTRSIAQGEGRAQDRKKETGEMEKRMKRSEEKVDRQQKEVSRLRDELRKIEALTPKIAELSAAFETL